MKASIGFLLCLISASAFAQIAKLSGHVQDRMGTNLAGADVSVKIGNHEVAHETTDATGVFSFSGDEGKYDVSITMPNFWPMKSEIVSFKAGPPVKLLLVLEVWVDTDGNKYAVDYEPAHHHALNPWDLSVFVQGGNGLEDRSSFHFLSAGAYAGRVLTNDYTSLRANFEYGVEVLPLWQSYTPKFQRINCPYSATAASQCSSPTTSGGTYRGISIVPIVLRINMKDGSRHWWPWIQGAGGVIYTTRKYPGIGSTNYQDSSQTAPNADTSVWNFDPQFGIGTHYALNSRRSIDVSANAVHISSASLGDKNPGVNTGVQFTLGYSWWK